MKIKTRALGEIEIKEEEVINFPEGVFAFEHLHQYVILLAKPNSFFYWLQSVEDARLAFLIMKPEVLFQNYQPKIHPQALSLIGIQNCNEAEVWGIVTIPQSKPQNMTINLQGPILINRKQNLGAQFISEDEEHSVRVKILEFLEKG